MENKTFYHLSDLHIYANRQIGSFGKYFERRCNTDQKLIAESEAIIDSLFEKVCEDKETKVVIISGDLTNDGEKDSHALMLQKLKTLKDSGKEVYVTFATHDYYMQAKKYTDDGEILLENYSRAQLRDLYNDYGFSSAVSEHQPSYSYAIIPFEKTRFLMLNDDGDGRDFCGYDETLIEWIKEQVKVAKANGERVIAVTHHPVMPPVKAFPVFSHRDMLGNYEEIGPLFASLGIEFAFTGHTHMQSIDHIDTEDGKRFYHVDTGAAVGFPAPYRKVKIEEYGIDVKTQYVSSFKWNEETEKDASQYFKKHFLFTIEDLFDTMENDIEAFKKHAIGFSMEGSTVDKLKPILLLMGKVVNNITFKQLGKILFISNKIDKSVENRNVREFALELIGGAFNGERHYPPNTSEYKATMAAAKRLGKLVKFKQKKGQPLTLEELAEDLLCNVGDFDNNNAFLPF